MDRMTLVVLLIGAMGVAAMADAWLVLALLFGIVATLLCIEAAEFVLKDLDEGE